MALSSPKKLHTDVSNGNFKPIYYFFGAEDYRIGEAVKFVVRQFVPDRQLTTNFQRLDGRKTKCHDLIAELSVFPMLGERQAFWVTDFQSYKPTEIARVLKILQPPDPNRILIFTSPSQRRPKKNSAFVKKLSALAETVEFGLLTPSQTATKIRTRLTKAGLSIEPAAQQLLANLLCGNRGALENELGKLIDFKPAGETVTSEDVRQIAAGYEVYSVFELADYVIQSDRRKVLEIIKQLLAEGSSATGLLFFLAQHFISLYLVKAGKGLETYRRWLEPRFREQGRQYELVHIEQIICAIAETDADLRRKRTPPELQLDRLVLKIMAT